MGKRHRKKFGEKVTQFRTMAMMVGHSPNELMVAVNQVVGIMSRFRHEFVLGIWVGQVRRAYGFTLDQALDAVRSAYGKAEELQDLGGEDESN